MDLQPTIWDGLPMSTISTPLLPTTISSYGTPDIFHQTYNIVIYGDDLSANSGQWAQTFQTRLDMASDTMFQFAFGTGSACTTVATAGQTLVTMASHVVASVDSLISGSLTNVLIVQGGNADAVGGATGAQIATNMWSVTSGRHTAGWSTVIVVGMLQSSGNATVYAAANAALKSGYAGHGVDAYVDVTGDTVLGASAAYSNALYFNSDKLTLNQNGVVRYSDQLIVPVVKAALGL
jgi:hypothetical protein